MSTRNCWGRPYPIARALPTITGRALRRYGFQAGELALRWAEIVGPQFAAVCAPERLGRARGTAGATLLLRVLPARALDVQHLAPLLVERVNAYYGRAVVDQLRLQQGPLPPVPPARPPAPPLDPPAEAELARGVAGVEDPALRAALLRLGRHAVQGRPGAANRAAAAGR